MGKKTFAGMTAVMLAFALVIAGCGKSADEGKSGPGQGQEQPGQAGVESGSAAQESSAGGDETAEETLPGGSGTEEAASPDSAAGEENTLTSVTEQVKEPQVGSSGQAGGGNSGQASGEAGGKKSEAAGQRELTGRKLSVCGDSISTFTGYIPENYSKYYPENGNILDVEQTWWKQVLNRSGMSLCKNASYSGSTVSGDPNDLTDGRSGCGHKRIADLAGADGSSPDVIIVAMGANDVLDNVALGVYEEGRSIPQNAPIDNFGDAYAVMLDKIRAAYPQAEVYCCTIAPISRWNDETGEKMEFANGQGLTARDYNGLIEQIAASKGAKLIDWYGCGITKENAKELTSDGTHPNPAGASLLAEAACRAMGIK